MSPGPLDFLTPSFVVQNRWKKKNVFKILSSFLKQTAWLPNGVHVHFSSAQRKKKKKKKTDLLDSYKRDEQLALKSDAWSVCLSVCLSVALPSVWAWCHKRNQQFYLKIISNSKLFLCDSLIIFSSRFFFFFLPSL